jgi:hypothetical protein
MGHNFQALQELELELRRAIERPQGGARASLRRAPRLLLVAAAVLVLLGGAAVALAASGVILTGAAVPAPRFASRSAGAGLPQPGKWKLLSLRVADPDGAPPWGMRLVRTTRGLVCVQLGRVQEGVLGELGIDGAFHNDLRFHPVGPGVLPTYAGGAADGGMTSERGSCVLAYGDVVAGGQAWGSAVTAEVSGADQNAAFPEAIAGVPSQRTHEPAAHRRRLVYGILGPHAVSVTYRSGGSLHVVPVARGSGAFLIVLPDSSGSESEGHGEAPGTDTPGEGPGTVGPLVKITYDDHGHICENGSDAETGHSVVVAHPCPAANPYPPSLRVTPPGSFNRVPQATLEVHHGRVIAADVSLSAPFAVTSAAEEYAVESEPCGPRAEGLRTAVLDRNVAAGQTVHLRLEYPFSDSCTRRGLTVAVVYQAAGPDAKRSYGRAPGELVIGKVRVRLPKGDRGAQPPGAAALRRRLRAEGRLH